MLVHQAYRYALDPTDRQIGALASHCGAARFAFNFGLALVKARLDARAASESIEVPWTLPALRREWNAAKPDVAPWWADNSKEAYSGGLDALARALKGWSASRKGKRAGKRVGFPRFRRKGVHDSCRFTTGAIRITDARHIVLPRLGTLRTAEDTDSLTHLLTAGKARILSATISREADRWFVSFGLEVDRAAPRNRAAGEVIGVDLGVATLATLSDGTVIANPRPLTRYLRRLRRLSRAHSRKQRGSANRRRSAMTLARLHRRIRNIRTDQLHKLTTNLAKNHGRIVVEDLHVAGMVRNRHLARAISDAGFGELRRQLIYKAAWYGSELVIADRFFPSSKRCSACGEVREHLTLAERTFVCGACGFSLDRDHSAALNLLWWATARDVAVSATETLNACGGDIRPGQGLADAGEAGTGQPITGRRKTRSPQLTAEVLAA
jgi:putative transposase